MSILSKAAFGALTGFGVALVAHAYGPGNPATLPSVPPGFAECGVDGAVCRVPAGATAYVVYGTNGKFATAQGTGDFTCLPAGWVRTPTAAKPQDLGIPDPVPNVQKRCYVQRPAAAPTPPVTPTPVPPVAANPGGYVPRSTSAAVLGECASVIGELGNPNIRGTLADSQARMQRVTNYCRGNISAECDKRIGYANTPNTGINPITLKNVVANCKK